MQRIVNEIARKAEQHMGFGRGLNGETARKISKFPFLNRFFASQNCHLQEIQVELWSSLQSSRHRVMNQEHLETKGFFP